MTVMTILQAMLRGGRADTEQTGKNTPTLEGKPFEISRVGTFRGKGGGEVNLSEGVLKECAIVYNARHSKAPLVVGHPREDAPSYGWVERLEYRDGALWATAAQVNESFSEAVRTGAYGNRSASFYLPSSPSNPTPGKFYLKHVGFLGAQPPAVKGLAPIEFSCDDDSLIINVPLADHSSSIAEFAETLVRRSIMSASEKARVVTLAGNMAATLDHEDFSDGAGASELVFMALAKHRARAVQHKTNQDFAEELMHKGIIRPIEREAVVALAEKMSDDHETIEFSEGGENVKSDALTLFKRILGGRAPLVYFNEIVPGGKVMCGYGQGTAEFSMPDGLGIDTARAELHHSATAYMRANNCDYRTAVLNVSKQERHRR